MLVRTLVAASLALALCGAVTGSAAAAPINDDFAAALAGAGDQLEGSGNNYGATKQSGEPDHAGDPGGASVWFAWTAPRSQSVFVQVCSEGWHAVLGVYRGGSLGALQPVASARTSTVGSSCRELRFPATSGVEYRLAVDGAAVGGDPAEGNFDFTIFATPPELPANDAFAAATVVRSTTYEYISGSTGGATREPGEPGDGDLAGASVWFRWTAPSSGAMRLFPCRAGFRMGLAVYTGSSLATLRSVGTPTPLADPSLPSDCQLGGQAGIGFDAVAGEAYSFEVDSGSVWGSFQLLLLPAPTRLVDVYPPGTYIYKLLRLRKRGIAIQFGSSGGPTGDTFFCKLDRQRFAPCKTPQKWRRLEPGMHRVAVYAVDAVGNRDTTPAVRTFRIGGGGSR